MTCAFLCIYVAHILLFLFLSITKLIYPIGKNLNCQIKCMLFTINVLVNVIGVFSVICICNMMSDSVVGKQSSSTMIRFEFILLFRK